MPQVNVVGTIEELKLGSASDAIITALSGQSPSKEMYLYVEDKTSLASHARLLVFSTVNTEIHARLAKLSLVHLKALAKSLLCAIEEWNPKNRKEIEVEFPWSEGKRRRLRVEHSFLNDGGCHAYLFKLSLV